MYINNLIVWGIHDGLNLAVNLMKVVGKCKSFIMGLKHDICCRTCIHLLTEGNRNVCVKHCNMDLQTNWDTYTRTRLIVRVIRMAYKRPEIASQFEFLSLSVTNNSF